MFGLVVIILFALISISANFITPYSAAIKQSGKIRLQGPSLDHIFGTDGYGRDVFARIIYGSRISLTLGFATTLISVLLGGFFRRRSRILWREGGQHHHADLRHADVYPWNTAGAGGRCRLGTQHGLT